MVRLAIALLVVALPASAIAGDQPKPVHEGCTCRAKGQRLQLGDEICLDTADGPRMAMCVMNQNLPFWSFSKEGCATSSLSPRPGLAPPNG